VGSAFPLPRRKGGLGWMGCDQSERVASHECEIGWCDGIEAVEPWEPGV
jgi:hypothetical protein